MKAELIHYEDYLRMTETPAGAILRHVLGKLGVSQKRLSDIAGIRPQHVNALIMGSRRFSVESSLLIERVLGITIDGFFYKCQCNYDIAQAKKISQRKPDITKLRKSTFWDVDLEKVDWQRGKRWAILRVLEYGCESDINEIVRLYGRESFAAELGANQAVASVSMRHNASLSSLI